jgi:hypothetical protein
MRQLHASKRAEEAPNRLRELSIQGSLLGNGHVLSRWAAGGALVFAAFPRAGEGQEGIPRTASKSAWFYGQSNERIGVSAAGFVSGVCSLLEAVYPERIIVMLMSMALHQKFPCVSFGNVQESQRRQLVQSS